MPEFRLRQLHQGVDDALVAGRSDLLGSANQAMARNP